MSLCIVVGASTSSLFANENCMEFMKNHPDKLSHLSDLLSDRPFVISKDRRTAIESKLAMSTTIFLQSVISLYKNKAQPRISNYHVAAAGLSQDGDVLIGVNLEFPQLPIGQTVHAEQFLISLAHTHKKRKITNLALSAAPCGHCRQFLRDTHDGLRINIHLPDHATPITLESLLPFSFGFKDFTDPIQEIFSSNEFAGLTLSSSENESRIDGEMLRYGLNAARLSFAPSTKAPSSVVIKTSDEKIFAGSYLENSGYNPSLPASQAAIISLIAGGGDLEKISQVTIFELENLNPMSPRHAQQTEQLIKSLTLSEVDFKRVLLAR